MCAQCINFIWELYSVLFQTREKESSREIAIIAVLRNKNLCRTYNCPATAFSLIRKADLKQTHVARFPEKKGYKSRTQKTTFTKVHGLRSLSRCPAPFAFSRSSLFRAIRKLYVESPGIDTTLTIRRKSTKIRTNTRVRAKYGISSISIFDNTATD